MKKIKIYFFVSLLFLAKVLMAQDRPVSIGLAGHAVNFSTDKYFENWQWGVGKILLGIPISEKLTVSPAFAFGSAKINQINSSAFWDLDASLQYALTKTKLQPYLTVGAGANRFEKNTYGTFNGGVGVNYWLSENFALTAQTTYDATPKFDDYWHNTLGLKFRLKSGPKDSDKDGIADDKDACPSVKGVSSANGCPDADGDGVKDSDDTCVNEKGTAATMGCPDNDGDGVANAEDNCPEVFGKTELKGCPDGDGDGVADKDDACPSVKGVIKFNGCPDSDGDGTADNNDKCPNVVGNVANQGCPDGDGDGVSDEQDKCPTQAGTIANNGCPEIKDEEVKQIESKLNLAAKKIQFETGKAVIRQVSYQDIDEIVAIMNQYGWTRFRIEGHTDNVGDAAKNKVLSDNRATAVKDYIISKGINSERLTTEGFGSQKPIASNSSVNGRAQNRRVEIHLEQ